MKLFFSRKDLSSFLSESDIFFSKTITILVSLKYEQVDYSIDDDPEKEDK